MTMENTTYHRSKVKTFAFICEHPVYRYNIKVTTTIIIIKFNLFIQLSRVFQSIDRTRVGLGPRPPPPPPPPPKIIFVTRENFSGPSKILIVFTLKNLLSIDYDAATTYETSILYTLVVYRQWWCKIQGNKIWLEWDQVKWTRPIYLAHSAHSKIVPVCAKYIGLVHFTWIHSSQISFPCFLHHHNCLYLLVCSLNNFARVGRIRKARIHLNEWIYILMAKDAHH